MEATAASAKSETERQQKTPPLTLWVPIATHILLLVLYLVPILQAASAKGEKLEPVFDEGEIYVTNQDTRGNTAFIDILKHDYWGKPIYGHNSNKSWRPFTVLTFRILKQLLPASLTLSQEVTLNRIINVLVHTSIAELVSIVGTQLFPTDYPIMTRAFIKVLFGVHPSHVEATANGANRPHLIGLLCSLVACDERLNLKFLYFTWLIGLTSCETIVFHVPAVFMTLFVVGIQRKRGGGASFKGNVTKNDERLQLYSLTKRLLPRFVIILGLTMTYILGRFMLGVEAINPGLYRKSQHPFHEFDGVKRVTNFAMVIAIHILKAFQVDPIGEAHEYGFNSVPELHGISDTRMVWIVFVYVGIAVSGVYCCRRNLMSTLHYMLFASWFATLFPISGFIPTGTFIAERLIVPSTVVVAIYIGGFLTHTWEQIIMYPSKQPKKHAKKASILLTCALALSLIFLLSIKTAHRIGDWCDRTRLTVQTLAAFPNNAKSNHEYAASVLSTSNPPDVKRAKEYAEKAISIWPDFCSVHMSLAKMALMENNAAEFEQRMAKAIPCSDTHQQAMTEWTLYWQTMIQRAESNQAKEALLSKYEAHMKIIVPELRKSVAEWNKFLPKDKQIDASVLNHFT
mmetsp:Transcript_13480/g.20517  ORF Transcript_13480/g.20517 Transcript_13480/m.20517 type:complete len:627 (+) Transcript_13480:36-1916(+)